MKYYRLLLPVALLSVIIITSCGSGQSGSDESNGEEAETAGPSGVFLKNTDTLKITKNSDPYFTEIEFDLMAKNESWDSFVFNTAPLVSGDENQELYALIDTLIFPKQYYEFTYSYKTDSWQVLDKLFADLPDSLKRIDVSGEYKRME